MFSITDYEPKRGDAIQRFCEQGAVTKTDLYHCVRRVSETHGRWCQKRLGDLVKEVLRNRLGILGEIRAFHRLSSHFGSGVSPQAGRGADFRLDIFSPAVLIEVATPQGRTKTDRTIQGMRNLPHKDGVTITESIQRPMGNPKGSNDLVQGEAISWLCGRKEKEHQVDEENLSILWFDLAPLPVHMNRQSRPWIHGLQELTSGAIWWSCYGRKGDRIFDHLSLLGFPSEHYELQFDTRFMREEGSKFDLLIADSGREIAILQNPRSNGDQIMILLDRLVSLPGLRLEESWIDWPVADSLDCRIAQAREMFANVQQRLRGMPD